MSIATWYLTDALYQLRLTESQLGVTSTVLASVPNLAVALIIRSAFALAISDAAGRAEATATMFAAAIHDQITVPAIILFLAPGSWAYFPHAVAIYAVLAKFALLDRTAFTAAVPLSLLFMAVLAVKG